MGNSVCGNSSLSSQLLGHEAHETYRVVGLPIFLFFGSMYIALLFVSVVRNMNINLGGLGLMRGISLLFTVFQLFLSVFLFFSAAWAFAMVNFLVSFVVIVAVLTNDKQLNKWTFFILGLDVLYLIGIFPNWHIGIFDTVVNSGCCTWYGGWGDKMCKEGWLAALEVFISFIFGAHLVNMFTFFAFFCENSLNLAPTDISAIAQAGGSTPYVNIDTANNGPGASGYQRSQTPEESAGLLAGGAGGSPQ
eukprot:TRINITY_DN67997_c8_g1_i1.p1 TRINITY_DN67997_c8_g1~~TRINITY_DN67997_c8_g1_i1.p1  ORF type:complete len:289 (+),score=38.29 TRINITY_DN67997_c8_g1_i1:126-869(+)